MGASRHPCGALVYVVLFLRSSSRTLTATYISASSFFFLLLFRKSRKIQNKHRAGQAVLKAAASAAAIAAIATAEAEYAKAELTSEHLHF